MSDHKYYFISRPPSIGTHPAGETDWEDWFPCQQVEAPEGRELWSYGLVVYAQPLAFYQVWKYDLLPADPVERICYVFYLDAERDLASTLAELQEYWTFEQRREYAGRDWRAHLVCWLQGNGYTQDEVLKVILGRITGVIGG